MLVMSLCMHVFAQTPAFPGAEGHGRYTTGGRGGNVYYVNNLTDVNTGNTTTREGSLRWCLNQTGPRTILFKVSGTIFLTSELKISRGDVTIAGQSAPGDGICVAGFPVTLSANNIIIRFLRFRMGDASDTNADGADALGGRFYKNLMIDHCSMSWSTDECVSIYGNENTTLQWCVIAESLRLSGHSKGAHGYGGIWGGNKASFHHNLMAHHDSRTPRLGPSTQTQLKELTDVRNNVFYNYNGSGSYGAEAMNVNMVNNFFKPGPASKTGTSRAKILSIDKKINLPTTDGFYPINNKWGKFYIDGNVVDASTSTGSDATACNNATANNWMYGVYNQFASQYGSVSTTDRNAMKVDVPFDAGQVTTHTAAIAYDKVLAHAGASLSRDTHDARIVNETRTGTAAFRGKSSANVSPYPKWGIIDSQSDLRPANAAIDWSAWPTLNGTTAPTDTNRDGIPDGWLEANYPGKLATDINDEGYTYLELYLNSLVQHIVDAQLANAISTSTNGVRSNKITSFKQSETQITVTSETMIHSLQLFHLSGIKLSSVKPLANEYVIDVSSLQAGIYLLKIIAEGANETFTQKIVR